MILLVICWIMSVLQLLSMWVSIARKDKKKEMAERKRLGRKLSCTVGFPAVVSIIISIPFIFLSDEYSWIPMMVLIVLDAVMLFEGADISKKIFKDR